MNLQYLKISAIAEWLFCPVLCTAKTHDFSMVEEMHNRQGLKNTGIFLYCSNHLIKPFPTKKKLHVMPHVTLEPDKL